MNEDGDGNISTSMVSSNIDGELVDSKGNPIEIGATYNCKKGVRSVTTPIVVTSVSSTFRSLTGRIVSKITGKPTNSALSFMPNQCTLKSTPPTIQTSKPVRSIFAKPAVRSTGASSCDCATIKQIIRGEIQDLMPSAMASPMMGGKRGRRSRRASKRRARFTSRRRH